MPTIEQLEPVIVASDDDKIPVSQGGVVRRVSRAQFLSGTQPVLSLTTGLLGRTSAGFGPPERIGVGGSLTLSNGLLSSPPQYAVSALPQSTNASSTDLVAISKAGHDMAVPVAALLSATGADVSGQIVKTSIGDARKLSDWAADALKVEAFGAIGDGVIDDTPAFVRALASGQPVRLGAKTYRVDGQWTITTSAVFIGIPGATTIRRVRQSGGAWITVSAPSLVAVGITFDAGGLSADSWAVQITPTCTTTLFDSCTFANAAGPNLGCGLTIQARDGLSGGTSSHTVRSCTFRDNAVHGLWIQAASGALVCGCTAFRNGSYGICLDFNDPSFAQIVRHCSIVASRCWSNQRGISVGNYNESNQEPPRWGPGNPDARDILIADNICFDNSAYGIAASGLGLQIRGNKVSIAANTTTASGFLFNASQSALSGNSAFGAGQFGIDAGGCVDCDITANSVNGFQVGINAGGGTRVRVSGNRLMGNRSGVTAFQVETDGAGSNFGIPCTDLHIVDNVIDLPTEGGAGILLFDGPANVRITGNQLTCADSSAVPRAIVAHSSGTLIAGNTWNGTLSQSADIVQLGGLTCLQVPEIADRISIPATATSIAGIVGSHQFGVSGQVTFIQVKQGGHGYVTANIAIQGAGVGAQAQAYVRDGVVIGIAIVSGGSGYGAADVKVSISGEGQGAVAQAFVGLPVPEGRRLTLTCVAPAVLRMDGAVCPFDNWTGAPLTLPARSEVVCVGAAGSWRAVSFVATDYISPAADGSLSLRSASGDVILRPRGNGSIRIASDNESSGFVSCLGRGSPEGVVSATPGSDYRNLDGGAGQTLWLKRSGSGSSGWFAIG